MMLQRTSSRCGASSGSCCREVNCECLEPIEIIAIASDKNYAKLAPLVNDQPTTAPGFWLSGEDRIFVVLNLFEPDSWHAVEHQFAHYMLDCNYPPTPPWFDEGFAEYFASLNLTAKTPNSAATRSSLPPVGLTFSATRFNQQIRSLLRKYCRIRSGWHGRTC